MQFIISVNSKVIKIIIVVKVVIRIVFNLNGSRLTVDNRLIFDE